MKSKCEWNAFYSKNPYPYGSEPSDHLKELVPYLNKGVTLEIACGTGRNSIYLAKNGFKVTAIDFSEIAIEQAMAQSKELEIEYKKMDLDFFLSHIMSLDTVICVDYKCSQRLLDDLKKGLQIGGTLYIEAFTYEHLKKYNPVDMTVDNCYKTFELAKLVKSWNVLYYDERQETNACKVKALLKKPSF